MAYALALLASAAISFFGFTDFHPAPEPQFQAALPGATAVFETSLAAPITSSATTMTLTANAVRGGGSISGYNCFTIDEGSAQHEVVCGTVSSTAVTAMTRGHSFATGTTTVAANQYAHRRGANVKITDFPVIQILKAQANGEDTYANILKYASHPTFTANTDIVDKKYVDDAAFSGAGVIDATTAARGVVELATQVESASSTANGSSGPLAIPASSATSTYNSATAALRIVVTQNNGKIDNGFIATSTLYAGQTFAAGTTTISGNFSITGTSTVASSTIRAFTASTSPTTTWTKPTALKYVLIEVISGGGGGGGVLNSGSYGAGGGGGGGYCKKIIPAAALGSTETVTVGGAGAAGAANQNPGGAGGPSSFGSHCTTTGGAGGSGASGSDGAAGGTASSGDINISGQSGGPSGATSFSGAGGISLMGSGGVSRYRDVAGQAGNSYGGGGSGSFCDGACTADAGGAGAGGGVFVTEYYF